MKFFKFCISVYFSVWFYSCSPVDVVENIDMTDDRGTFLANTSPYMNGLCWSADGTEIYYFTDKLYAVNINTKTVRTLGDLWDSYVSDRNIIASNDGNKIYYENNGSLCSIGTDGQNFRVFIYGLGAGSIALSPDNDFIAYTASNSSANIYKISDSTSRQYTLNAQPISFSPDGINLMFKSYDSLNTNIYQMNVSDGTYQVLFNFSNFFSTYGCARWDNDAFKMIYELYIGTKYNLWNSSTNSNTTIFSSEPPSNYNGHPELNIGSTEAAFWTRKLDILNGNEISLFNLHLVNLNNLQSTIEANVKISGVYYTDRMYIAFSSDGLKIAYGIDSKIYMKLLQ